jgi:hypothetical protein
MDMKMKSVISKSIRNVACLLLLTTSYLSAQENNAWGINAGLGFGSSGASYGLNWSSRTERRLISLRYVRNEEFDLFGGLSPAESVWDLGVLYGPCARGGIGYASISAGLSLAGGVRRGQFLSSSGGMFGTDQYEKLNFLTLGIPLEAQAFLTGSNIGIGIYAFANLNRKRSFAGALLCLQFGQLK